MFLIGARIFYPKFGAGYIINIEDKEIYGVTKKYYVIKLLSSNMFTMIPVEFEDTKRLRKVIEKNECQRVWETLKEAHGNLPLKWIDRYKLYNHCINEGDIFELVKILRDIRYFSINKEISNSDAKIFGEILNTVASELGVIYEIEHEMMKTILSEEINKIK